MPRPHGFRAGLIAALLAAVAANGVVVDVSPGSSAADAGRFVERYGAEALDVDASAAWDPSGDLIDPLYDR